MKSKKKTVKFHRYVNIDTQGHIWGVFETKKEAKQGSDSLDPIYLRAIGVKIYGEYTYEK